MLQFCIKLRYRTSKIIPNDFGSCAVIFSHTNRPVLMKYLLNIFVLMPVSEVYFRVREFSIIETGKSLKMTQSSQPNLRKVLSIEFNFFQLIAKTE